MPQSLASLNIHLVFSTKDRRRYLSDAVRDPTHRYMATVLTNMRCHVVLLNSVEDHIHLLFDLGRTNSISKVVEEVKKSSSKWMKTQGPPFASFSWQEGYAAFAVDATSVTNVREYIANQQEHHRGEGFQDEYRQLLSAHGVKFDERYIWD